ncbi:MAG: metalloregulator ArsR/SmtB family transcription factor [Planctomycetota bacterium]|nr:metalloregulator ArsR/SmtB family transcription factor [Planctomycetota bacterium]
MEMNAAIETFTALAHETRLRAFRMLVKAGPEGMAAGRIASELDVAPPTLSFHLAQLVRAQLLDSRREGRSVIYGLRTEGVRDLLGFLTEDCCGGRPELCAPTSPSKTTEATT